MITKTTKNPNATAPNKRPAATMNLQDRLYAALKEDRIKTKVFLTNGFQMDGIIKEVDNFTILVLKDGQERMIYKHAISTIEPTKKIDNTTNRRQSSNTNLQERLYTSLKEGEIKAKIYLTNGFQLDGIIKDFDNFTILILKDGREDMIYKHAISTIEPSKAVFY